MHIMFFIKLILIGRQPSSSPHKLQIQHSLLIGVFIHCFPKPLDDLAILPITSINCVFLQKLDIDDRFSTNIELQFLLTYQIENIDRNNTDQSLTDIIGLQLRFIKPSLYYFFDIFMSIVNSDFDFRTIRNQFHLFSI